MKRLIQATILAAAALLLANCAGGLIAQTNEANASGSKIARDSRSAINTLYRTNPKARDLAHRSRGVLVFPEITKAGFMVGGMGGNGALLRPGGGVQAFYQTAGVSYGLQAGAQKYSYALFLMNERAIRNLNQNGGWEVGSAPSLVVIDQGVSGALSNVKLDKDVYAIFFGQKGLMAGLGLQGSKITRIHPKN